MDSIFFTGATGGLGFPCVKALSERGYEVFAAGTNREKLEKIGKLPNVTPVFADVTDTESILAARRTVQARTEKLRAVVNLAGLTAFCSMVEGDCTEIAEKLLQVNVMGMIRVNRAFFDMVYAGGGRIVNCSSEAGWMTPPPFAAPYYLSKHAVEAYSDSLRRELAVLGVPVIKLQPGSFKTGMLGAVNSGFEKTVAETRYYGKCLARMKPMMTHETEHGSDPGRLAAVLVRAVEAKRPKPRYRVGTGKRLALMELLPDRWLDGIFRIFMKG